MNSFEKPILFCENKEYLDTICDFGRIEYDGVRSYKKSMTEFKNSYSLVVSLLYANPLSNFIILKSRLANVPTMLISDGIIDWSNMFKNPMVTKYNQHLFHPIIHDVFLCVGSDETDYFNHIGVNAVQFLPKRMKPTFKKLGSAGNNVFLITTANTSYFDEAERKILVHLLKAIMQQLVSAKENFIFRIYDPHLIQELNIEDDKNLIDCNFEEALSVVDFVITSPSSVSYLTMYHGKPLAHLIYRDSPVFIQAGWNINSLCSLPSVIASMKTFEKERMVFQDFQVKKYSHSSDDLLETAYGSISENADKDLKQFVDQNLYNLINSKFNINFEYTLRKAYLRLKAFRIVQYIRSKIH